MFVIGNQEKVKKVKVTQSCLTLCDPMDCSLPGSSIYGIFQARVLEWGAIALGRCKSELRKKLPWLQLLMSQSKW